MTGDPRGARLHGVRSLGRRGRADIVLVAVAVQHHDAYVDHLVVGRRAVETDLDDDRGRGVRRPLGVQGHRQAEQVHAGHLPRHGGVAPGAQHVGQGVGIAADEPQLRGDHPLVVGRQAHGAPALEGEHGVQQVGVGDAEAVVGRALGQVPGPPPRVSSHDVGLQVRLRVEPDLSHLLADAGEPVALVVGVA